MPMAMRFEIIQRQTIKPSSPTPHDLRSVELSLVDQFIPIGHVPLVLFYPVNGRNNTDDDHHHLAKLITERSLLLKTSLAETLTRFYPLAGRLKDNSSIECDDHGVQYIEARIKSGLSEILQNPETEVLKQLLPAAIEPNESVAARDSQLLVQASFFDCGGLAIGLRISHKISDAATLATFIKCWSAIAVRSSEVVSPVFNGASIFPQMDLSMPMIPVDLIAGACVTKRFVFDASKIAALKAKAASAGVPEPTRVEAVTALIWKCAMSASRSNLESPGQSVLCQGVNLRKRFVPPVPDTYAGNYVGNFAARTEGGDLELQGLVSELRKGIRELGEKFAKISPGDGASLALCRTVEEFEKLAANEDVEFYSCTSWCKFELYDADFGWGKPTWVSIASEVLKNCVILMDARDGVGLEAGVSLTKENMAVFESNEELLEFAVVNPGVGLAPK